MANVPKIIDLEDGPDLVHLLKEVGDSDENVVVRQGGEEIALIMPLKPRPASETERTITEADIEAFLSAAGGWKHIDTDKLLEDIYADRDISL